MGASVAIPAVLGAVGLYQNEQARKDQKKAMNRSKKAEDRSRDVFEMLMGIVQDADKGGQFDPEKYIAQLETDDQRNQKTELDNIGGAARIMGYKPGDSVPQQTLSYAVERRKKSLDTLKTDLRRQTFLDKLNAYGSVNPGYLNPQIQGGYNAAAAAGSRIQNPANFLGSVMPYLGGGNKGGAGPVPVPGVPTTTGKWKLPVSY